MTRTAWSTIFRGMLPRAAILCFLLMSLGLLCLASAGPCVSPVHALDSSAGEATPPADADPAPATANPDSPPAGFRAGGAWQLEFGPLVGYYDFDSVTYFEDGLLLGLRMGARRSPHMQIEVEFTEVYTSRVGTGNTARQVSAALHVRYEPLEGCWSPSVMGGIAFVALDDSEDPDSYGDAWDGGLALAYRVDSRWLLRVEWMLRFQRYTLVDPNLPPDMQSNEVQDTWARSIHLGVFYVF